MPVLQRVAAAGWQPVTHARADGLHVERFGRRRGRLYFTVRNTGRRAVKSELCIDADALGLDVSAKPFAVSCLYGTEPGEFTTANGRCRGPVCVPPGRTLVLAVR